MYYIFVSHLKILIFFASPLSSSYVNISNFNLSQHIFTHHLQKGEIIPQEFTFDYLRQELSKAKYDRGFLLDGYPKDTHCFQFIFQTLQDQKKVPAAAVFFDISREEVHKRLTGRLLCKKCERNYHKHFKAVRPIVENCCDFCSGTLTSRGDDTPTTINRRLDSYDQKTLPNVQLFQSKQLLIRVNAVHTPSRVNRDILKAMESMLCPPRKAYFLKNAQDAETASPATQRRSCRWHNHMDAESDVLLQRLVRQVESLCPGTICQNKIYPISHLILGPQTKTKKFESVYCRLPNFHPIHEAEDEAFSTGALGDEMDYAMTSATLLACSLHPNRGVMTEIEEDLFEMSSDGNNSELAKSKSKSKPKVHRNDGDSISAIDWDRLGNNWKEKMIPGVPKYELHHGVDLPKLPSDGKIPPISLLEMSRLTNREDAPGNLCSGGWFVFEKEERWAYRSNEFSNQTYDECKERLVEQFDDVRHQFAVLLAESGDHGERSFSNSCSLEKVHAMWRF